MPIFMGDIKINSIEKYKSEFNNKLLREIG